MAKRQYALFTLNNAYTRFAKTPICIIMHIGVLTKRLYALKNNKKHIDVLYNAHRRFGKTPICIKH